MTAPLDLNDDVVGQIDVRIQPVEHKLDLELLFESPNPAEKVDKAHPLVRFIYWVISSFLPLIRGKYHLEAITVSGLSVTAGVWSLGGAIFLGRVLEWQPLL